MGLLATISTISLAQQAEHRVAITGVTGSPPPETLKVALNEVGGYRNTMTMVLTGLDLEAKAAFAQQQLFDILGGRGSFAEVDVRFLRFDTPDAPTNDQACAHLRISKDVSDIVDRPARNPSSLQQYQPGLPVP